MRLGRNIRFLLLLNNHRNALLNTYLGKHGAYGRHSNPVHHPRLRLHNGTGEASCAQGSRKTAATTSDLCERHLGLPGGVNKVE